MNNERLLDLSEDIALLEELVKQHLEELADLGQPPPMRDLRAEIGRIRNFFEAGDADGALKSLQRLDEMAAHNLAVTTNHREIREILDKKRKMTESQRKSLLEAGEFIRTAQAIVLMDQLLNAVVSNINRIDEDDSVTSADILEAVGTEFRRITGRSLMDEDSGSD